MAIALGFSIHTGWAAAVVVKGPPPELLDRRKIELADPVHAARFVFHLASENLERADEIVQSAAAIARARAERALRGLPKGTLLALPATKRKLPELAAVLRSHALIHAAEGELYRNAIAEAARSLGLATVVCAAGDVPALGKVSPPWGKDQKRAAALAWAALRSPRGLQNPLDT
jgi:hypothetical protein